MKSEKVKSDVYAWITEKKDVFEYDEAIHSSQLKKHPEWVRSNMRLIGEGFVCGYDIYGNLWIDNSYPTHFYVWDKE